MFHIDGGGVGGISVTYCRIRAVGVACETKGIWPRRLKRLIITFDDTFTEFYRLKIY